jgi:Protein of unknown function (DUF1360)
MKFYWLVLGVLTVWRITHFLQAEDGPWDVVVRLRVAAGEGFLGKVLDCFYCLSVWIAAPVAWWIGESWPERVLLWFSLSAGASLLERVSKPEPKVPPPFFVEEPVEEKPDGVLRTEEESGGPAGDAGTAKH